MSDHSQDNLQFDKAVPQGQGAHPTVCTVCQNTLRDTYFALNSQILCGNCKDDLQQHIRSGNPVSRITKALGFGIPAAMLGSLIYFLIAKFTGYEFGLIAILIGYMVGYAVRKASNGIGGIPYQIIAVILTYCAISSTYIPYLIQGIEAEEHEQQAERGTSPENQAVATTGVEAQRSVNAQGGSDASLGESQSLHETITPVGYVILFVFSLTIPFMTGFQNILGLLIIGFGLYEAWRMNRKAHLKFEGPFEIKGSSSFK